MVDAVGVEEVDMVDRCVSYLDVEVRGDWWSPF